jgi:hypothetical protein
MIELRRSGVFADARDVERLKAEFEARHFALLPRLLEPALLDFLLPRLEQGPWNDLVHDGIGVEVVSADLLAVQVLHFVANAPGFLDVVRTITGCPGVTWFGGRIYRFIAGSGYDSWHDDVNGFRLVGMSLNLSPRGYEGGLFQLRDHETKRVLVEYANTVLGDATLFRISRSLDHQVTRVRGAEPRTAFAGWFQAGQPPLIARLRSGAAVRAG